mgnify:CR=1 FL=1|tara:strand:+ start:861 stop:1781 length:921 start_codon:yes stop_codon:yes gene_type:complete
MINYLNKIKKFFNKRIFKTPDLKYLIKEKNNTENKKKHVNYWLKHAKKNHSLFNFFFSPNEYVKKNENIDYEFQANKDSVITDQMFSALASAGILIIKNALPKDERENIICYFSELQKGAYKKNWSEKPQTLFNDNDTELTYGSTDISNFKFLKSYSDQASQAIYNKIVKPNVDFHYLKLINKSEKLIKGETYLHSDRFIPHFKMFYSPHKIDSGDAPFQFARSSHIVNENYKNFFINSKSFDETDELSKYLMNEIITVTVPENTLYISFTNGLHRRSDFKNLKSERCMLFLQYVERFNKFDYLLN